MGTSYPDKTNARGIWKLSDIYKNINKDGTYPRFKQRTCYMGGISPGVSTTIDYFQTVETAGNATDFGDLSVARVKCHGGLGSFTRRTLYTVGGYVLWN